MITNACCNCNSNNDNSNFIGNSNQSNLKLEQIISFVFGNILRNEYSDASGFRTLCTTCVSILEVFCNSKNIFLKSTSPNSVFSPVANQCDNSALNLPVHFVKDELNCNSQEECKEVNSESDDVILPDDNTGKIEENYPSHSQIIGSKSPQNSVGKFDCVEYIEKFIKLEVQKLPEGQLLKGRKDIRRNDKSVDSKQVVEESQCHCKRKFSDVETLNNHKTSAHNTHLQNLKCKLCTKQFFTEWFLKHHVNVCHQGIEIVHFCRLCSKKFDTEAALSEHTLTIHDIREHPFKCPHCIQSFRKIVDLRTHLIKEHKTTTEANNAKNNIEEMTKIKTARSFKCTICNWTSYSIHFLHIHMKIRHKVMEKFTCYLCNGEFESYTAMKMHRKCHTSCLKCDKKFLNYDRLEIHDARVHCHILQRPFKCEICGQAYPSYTGLGAHYYFHKSINGPRHFCNICNKAFKLKFHLNHHLKEAHSENKVKAQCAFCHISLTTKSNLNAHIRIKHSDQLTFPCKICGKMLLNSESCRAHSRIHTLETKLKKNNIQTNGNAKIDLVSGKVQVMSCYSSEIFLFTFPCCEKSCDSQANFCRHLKNVHSLIGYTDAKVKTTSSINCQICNKSYSRKDLMDKHRRRAHK